MMQINCEQQGSFGACCYMLAFAEAAVIIDPFEPSVDLRSFISENSGKRFYILLTHRHFDHVAGAAAVKRLCGGQTVISKIDECGLLSSSDSLGRMFYVNHETLSADITVCDGDVLSLGDIKIRVMLTPGHTEGSVCYITDDCIFSGDTLFHLGVGRTDFPSGSTFALQDSLERLFALSGDYKVYPGHGESTTLRYEEKNNPFYGKR